MKLLPTAAGLAALASVAAALLMAGEVASPALAKTPTDFEVTLTATLTGGDVNPFYGSRFFEGSGVIPKLGKVTFTGSLLQSEAIGDAYCLSTFRTVVPCVRELDLRVTSASGRQVRIFSSVEWTPPAVPVVGPWTASGDFTGSGTYELQPIFGEVGDEFTFLLSGTLERT
jgi:hypothetical protein